MPWNHADPVTERLRFVALVKEGNFGKKELCERFGVSRQTGHDTLKRYEEKGVDGLKDGSHAPHTCPHRIGDEMREILLAARLAHPHWGPRKILDWLRLFRPDLTPPAASTVGDLYSREKLVKSRPRTRNWSHPGRNHVRVGEPNDLWTMDFKGDFRMGDGQRCYPLTIADAHTRFLLVCHGLGSTAHVGALAAVERAFREYGLPRAIRTDNGGPFCTKAIAGLSRLNIWWTQLGIAHDRIARGHPEQNGSHERMHLTLKQATVFPPAGDMGIQQAKFDGFRTEFDFERPHEALGGQTPGSLYVRSPRELPETLPGPEYPGHCEIRQVRANGILYFKNQQIFLSELLSGHDVALEEIADGIWSIYFYTILLARLDVRTFTLSG
jgi:transposase InsO family protein